jgi:hypothetical protein
MTILSSKAKKQERLLLLYCKKYSGTYINNLNAHRAPFATTYSKEFCEGIADLCRLYGNHRLESPIHLLSRRLMENGIQSCRGHDMDIPNTTYLFHKHVARRLREGRFFVLPTLTQPQSV